MTDPNKTSVGDVPAPAYKHRTFSEANAAHAEALAERAAVVKHLRTMAESTTFSTRAQSALRLAAEEIERGMHQP